MKKTVLVVGPIGFHAINYLKGDSVIGYGGSGLAVTLALLKANLNAKIAWPATTQFIEKLIKDFGKLHFFSNTPPVNALPFRLEVKEEADRSFSLVEVDFGYDQVSLPKDVNELDGVYVTIMKSTAQQIEVVRRLKQARFSGLIGAGTNSWACKNEPKEVLKLANYADYFFLNANEAELLGMYSRKDKGTTIVTSSKVCKVYKNDSIECVPNRSLLTTKKIRCTLYAGDIFAGVCFGQVVNGEPLARAIDHANLTAALSITHKGLEYF